MKFGGPCVLRHLPVLHIDRTIRIYKKSTGGMPRISVLVYSNRGRYLQSQRFDSNASCTSEDLNGRVLAKKRVVTWCSVRSTCVHLSLRLDPASNRKPSPSAFNLVSVESPSAFNLVYV